MPGRLESIASPAPPGAARIRDLNFPDYTTAGTGAAIPGLRCRITGTSLNGVENNYTGAFNKQWLFAQGADAYQMFSGGAGGTGGSFSWFNTCNIQVRTSPLNHWALDDDWNVHRIVWIACINGAITSDNDMGVELLSTNTTNNAILKTPCPGFGFRFATGGKFNFITRTFGGGTTETTLATNGVGGYQQTDWHSYELRLFSALPNQPAFLKIVIDDAIVAALPWATSNLPANGEGSPAFPGFYPILVCNSANTAGMFTKLLSFQAGPTEAATL